MHKYVDKIKCYNFLLIYKYYTYSILIKFDILIHLYLCLSINRHIKYKKMKCYNFNIIYIYIKIILNFNKI